MKYVDWSGYNMRLYGWRSWTSTKSLTELDAAFEAGFKAGQVCGNGLEIAMKEFKSKK